MKHANPNGSLRNIAGICNQNRNVFGMMPHPERACSEALANTDGKLCSSISFFNKEVFALPEKQLVNF